MHHQSTSTTLQETIDALVRRKGLAYVERQYDSGLLSPVIEPAFEQWKLRASSRRSSLRSPMALATLVVLVAYFAVVWSV